MLTPSLFRGLTTAFLEMMRYLYVTKDSSGSVAWQRNANSLKFVFHTTQRASGKRGWRLNNRWFGGGLVY